MSLNHENKDNVQDVNHEKKKLHRRDFLKKSGTTVATAATFVGSLSACNLHAKNKSKTEKRLAMAIDLRKCYGYHSCSIACKSEFNVPLGVWRSWLKTIDKGRYPKVKSA